MRATIEHESRGRMRLRLRQKNMTLRQADLLEAWLKGQPWAKDAVVHERTCCAILTYAGDRAIWPLPGNITRRTGNSSLRYHPTARRKSPCRTASGLRKML